MSWPLFTLSLVVGVLAIIAIIVAGVAWGAYIDGRKEAGKPSLLPRQISPMTLVNWAYDKGRARGKGEAHDPDTCPDCRYHTGSHQ